MWLVDNSLFAYKYEFFILSNIICAQEKDLQFNNIVNGDFEYFATMQVLVNLSFLHLLI